MRILDRTAAALGAALAAPDHAALVEQISRGDARSLARELRDFLAEPGVEDAGLRPQAQQQLTQVEVWAQRLDDYAAVLEEGAAPIGARLAALEKAQEAFDTGFVRETLTDLRPIAEAITAADGLVQDNWRAARYFIRQARKRAAAGGLSGQLEATIASHERGIAESLRGRFDAAMGPARDLAQRLGDPPARWLDQVKAPAKAAEARASLNDLELEMPTGVGKDLASRAVEQNLLPWSVMSDADRAVLTRLFNWVLVEVPAADAGGQAILLTFIPEERDTGVFNSFWMGSTEVTLDQYKAVLGTAPECPQGKEPCRAMVKNGSHPVAYVEPDDAQEYCAELGKRLGGEILVRLARKEEWEHAYHAGRRSWQEGSPDLCKYSPEGKPALDPERANFKSDELDLGGFLQPGHADGFALFAPVASYPPSRWLLSDMVGNVSERIQGPTREGPYIESSFLSDAAVDAKVVRGPRAERPSENIGMRIVVSLQP